jgi:hypothetical protein
MSQSRRSFEIMEALWRVRDKSKTVSDASFRPSLLEHDSTAPNPRISGVCARCECVPCADRLHLYISMMEIAVNTKFYELIPCFPDASLIPM